MLFYWSTVVFQLLIIAGITGGMLVSLWWMVRGPTKRTRARIARILLAKHLKFIDVKPQPEIRFGRSSRCILVARTEDVFGNQGKQYFEIDIIADVFTKNARIHELGSRLSPVRFLGFPSDS